jgi:hypothetical protein
MRVYTFTTGVSNNRGESNPGYKGDDAGYGAIHIWVRRRKFKPELCERCGLAPSADLANKTNMYLRDLSDWEYLCRKCHMDSDGRNNFLRESGRSRKRPERECAHCKKMFWSPKDNLFCSRACSGQSRHKLDVTVQRTCSLCGKNFEVVNPQRSGRLNQKYCSRRCGITAGWVQRKENRACAIS